jgi:very-short-patch-repair endonuclease
MPDHNLRRLRTSRAHQERAQQLRREQTPAEAALWERLRNRHLDGVKFRRQHPIDRFIVDFCCVEHRLVVEIDGAIHAEQRDYDEERTEALQSLGYHVLRCTNDDVEQRIEDVLRMIRVEVG